MLIVCVVCTRFVRIYFIRLSTFIALNNLIVEAL